MTKEEGATKEARYVANYDVGEPVKVKLKHFEDVPDAFLEPHLKAIAMIEDREEFDLK